MQPLKIRQDVMLNKINNKNPRTMENTWRLLGLIASYLLYLVVGSAVFSAIEGPEEVQLVNKVRKLRENFLNEHFCVTG